MGQELAYFGHMSGRIRVLGPKDGTDAEDALPTTSNLELLVKLWRLGQECLLVKVWQAENVGAAFGCRTNEAWRLELLEAALLEVRAEQILGLGTDVLGFTVSDLKANILAQLYGHTAMAC